MGPLYTYLVHWRIGGVTAVKCTLCMWRNEVYLIGVFSEKGGGRAWHANGGDLHNVSVNHLTLFVIVF